MSSPFELSFSCDVPWESMEAVGGNRRHCGSCKRDVVDVSALTRKGAERLLARAPDTCISYVVGLNGDPVFSRRPTRPGWAVLASGLLAACAADPEPDACSLEPEPTVVEAPAISLLSSDVTSGPLDLDPVERAASLEPVATQTRELAGASTDLAIAGDRNDVDGAHPRRRRHTPVINAPVVVRPRMAGVPTRRH